MRIALLLVILTAGPARAGEAPAFAAPQGGGPLLGVVAEAPAPPLKLRWSYMCDEEDRAGVESAPVIVGGRVYVADGRGGVHGLDLRTGKAVWKTVTDGGFATSPVVVDGRIILGDLNARVHALAADTGKSLWQIETEGPFHASANTDGRRVFLGNDAAQILCLDPADGKVIWKAASGDRVNSMPTLAGGKVLVSGCDAHLRAYDQESGAELWAYDMEALSGASAVAVGDRLVAATDQGRVLCLAPDGKTRHWTYEQVDNQAMVYATPAVADGVIVAGARDRQIHALDLATGKRLWAVRTRGDVDAPAVIGQGRVYVGSADKRLYVLDLKTGRQLGDFTAGRAITAAVAIGQGVVVLADTGGNVYCLEPGP